MSGKFVHIEDVNNKRFMNIEKKGIKDNKFLVSMINDKSDLMKGIYMYIYAYI
jgi:hypothetical protein